MKKYILTVAITTILTISFKPSISQTGPVIDYKNLVAHVPAIERNEVSKPESSSLPVIHFKALKDFRKTNPDITGERWQILTGGFAVKFISIAGRTMYYYDQKGKWLYSIQQYDESKLRKDVRVAVKTSYYDYSITSVQEVNLSRSGENPIYIIHIKNGTTYKTIRFCDDLMEEISL